VIRIRGRLGATALSAFPSMASELTEDETVLSGTLEDSSALFGVLAQIEALGLELLELRETDSPDLPIAASGKHDGRVDHRDPARASHLGRAEDPPTSRRPQGEPIFMSDPADRRADVLIVGGGSAGAVMARRLSEDPGRTVLLLEAGRAYGPDEYPDDLRDPGHVPAEPEHEWGYTARGGPRSPEITAARAKVLGGCSAHNATVAMRARPEDIREWQAHGLADWTVEGVLETFKAMENTPDGEDAHHGRSGPFPIRHERYEGLTPSLQGFFDACEAEGYPRVTDFNGPDPAGIGADPVNVVDGVRQNTGIVYLTQAVRDRPNLTISGGVLVDRVLFDRGRAVGVLTGSGEEILAGEVILSAGSYGSPAILLRSGIGPAGDLADLGIEVVADLPVGRQLQDQPFYYNAYALKPEFLQMRPALGSMLWTRTSEAREDQLDLHITVTHLMPPQFSPTGGAITLSVALVKPDSRGTLTLRSRDPEEQPEIDCNFLAEERDMRRMLEGVRLSRRIGRHRALTRYTELEILPGESVGEDHLEDAIASNLESYGHPTATAPMGGHEDPWAVVDSRGAVRGIAGLRVVDASIMPVVPSVAINPTTIMIAERIAATAYGALRR
jgi:choline dehydrogenase